MSGPKYTFHTPSLISSRPTYSPAQVIETLTQPLFQRMRQSEWTPYRRQVSGATVLDEHRTWLAQRAPQVNYAACILHQELRGQRGFGGSYETVKLAVRPLRAEANLAGLTQRRFETGPGEQAQVVWGQVTVTLGEQPTKVHIFVMTLGYSRLGYAEGFLHEPVPDLLAAHERAFAHFRGRCENLLYDRMRTIVLGSSTDAKFSQIEFHAIR